MSGLRNYFFKDEPNYSGVVPSAVGSAGLSAILTGLASGGDLGAMAHSAEIGGAAGGGLSALMSNIQKNDQEFIQDSSGRVYAPTEMITPEVIDQMRASGQLKDIGNGIHVSDSGDLIHDSGKGVTYAHQPQILPGQFEDWKNIGIVKQV